LSALDDSALGVGIDEDVSGVGPAVALGSAEAIAVVVADGTFDGCPMGAVTPGVDGGELVELSQELNSQMPTTKAKSG